MALCEMSSALDEQSIGVSVLYVWPIKVLIENQCPASPELCQPSAGITVNQSYSYFLWAAALARWKEYHEEVTRQQEPPLLCFPGHCDVSFLWVKIFPFSFPNSVIIFIDPQAIWNIPIFLDPFSWWIETLQLLLRSLNFTFQNCTFKMPDFSLSSLTDFAGIYSAVHETVVLILIHCA